MATFASRAKKTWPAISSSSACLLFFTITTAVVNNPLLGNASPPTFLVVYDHENSVPPNNTAVVAVVTPGPPVGAGLPAFGSIFVVSNVLREGLAADSPVLGHFDGELTVGLESLYASAALVFDTPGYKGSITIQGSSDLAGNGEAAITGGTGDFRCAKGYLVTQATGEKAPTDSVFKLSLYIKYDD